MGIMNYKYNFTKAYFIFLYPVLQGTPCSECLATKRPARRVAARNGWRRSLLLTVWHKACVPWPFPVD